LEMTYELKSVFPNNAFYIIYLVYLLYGYMEE